MKIPNPTPKPNKKQLTRNEKIAGIVIIVLGSLFLLNEFVWRSQQDQEADKWVEDYCWEIRKIDPASYPGTNATCTKYEQRNK